ncbi:MAG: glycosyltransferase family 39 protein [Verrucomicrobiota bacterium]
MKPTSWLFFALILLTIARIFIGAFSELSGDEAYYFLWAERLDWSYYSKGPGVATVIWLSTALFGESELGVRILSPLLGLGTSYLLFRLARQLLSTRVAIGVVIMLNLTPIFNVGSIVLTIDPLMLFFWVAAMLTTWKAAHDDGKIGWWMFTGLLIGLGFLAKYTAAIQIVSIAIFLAVWPKGRAQFRQRGFYAMIGVLLLCTTPVLIWNSQNCWITVVHLFQHLGIHLNFCPEEAIPIPAASSNESEGFKLGPDIFVYLGYHLAVYSPLIFAGMFWALIIGLKRFRASAAEIFLGSFSLPIILGYFLISVFKMGDVNWTAPGFFGVGILLIRYFDDWKPRLAWKRTFAASAAAGIGAIMTVLVVNSDVIRGVGAPWPYETDPGARLRGWTAAAEALDEHTRQFAEETGETPFLIGGRYQVSAGIAFHLPDDLPVIRPNDEYPVIHMLQSKDGSIHNQFAFWPTYYDKESAPFVDANALFITDTLGDRLTPPSVIRDNFKDWALIDSIVIERRDIPLHEWKIFACYGFKTKDEEEEDDGHR